MPEAAKSRPRAGAEALQRKLPLPPGYLATIVQPNGETLGGSINSASLSEFRRATQGAGSRVEQTVEIPATTCRRPSIGVPLSARPSRCPFSQKQNPTSRPTLSGCMASAEWISEWHRTATNQEPIFCPKAPSSAAQRLFVSDGLQDRCAEMTSLDELAAPTCQLMLWQANHANVQTRTTIHYMIQYMIHLIYGWHG